MGIKLLKISREVLILLKEEIQDYKFLKKRARTKRGADQRLPQAEHSLSTQDILILD